MSSSSSSKPSPFSGFARRAFAWTVKPIGFVTGLVATLWRKRAGGGAAASNAKAPRLSRREEKQRRKELARAAKAPGRRRAA